MTFFFNGPKGRLEGELWLPTDDAEPRACAVMGHPNPAHGGTMGTTALFRASRGLQEAGLAVLRFNFRGVKQSEGEIEAGFGEIEDMRAALDELERRFPNAELWAGGFSFGARTAAALAAGYAFDDATGEVTRTEEPRVKRVVLVALPARVFDCSAVADVRVPGYVLQAGEDQFGNLAELREKVPNLEGLELDEIPGMDHFFKGQTHELQERVKRYALRNL